MRSPGAPRHDLAVVIVSANDGRWLPRCLPSLMSHLGDISADIVVVANGCTDETAEVVEDFPAVRLISAANRGFAAGNNRALPTCSARYVLFLNPDTEIRDGSFADLLEQMDSTPDVGLLGCRHVMPSGELQKTMRRFPSPMRIWGEALGSGRLRRGFARVGELVLDDRAYASEHDVDWVAGSFLLVRGGALAGAGYMDERFFLYSEETDFCLRVCRAGWRVVYTPAMTILHHAGKAGVNPMLEAQSAYARRQYAQRHFGGVRRRLFISGLASHYLVRVVAGFGTPSVRERHRTALHCVRISLGLEEPPFPTLTSVAVDRVDWGDPIEAGGAPEEGRSLVR